MLVIGKRAVAAVIGIALCGAAAGICAGVYAQTTETYAMPVIVIDAGHGGVDAGVYGVETNVKESDINLAIAMELRGRFVNAGFECVMTRTTAAGLYGNTSKGFKMRDMRKRRQIIEDCNADMVISIHQNTCPLPSRRGSYVFFDESSECSRQLADYIQSELNDLSGGVETNTSLVGDYYMLKCTSSPSVIVECGFLSNAEDEQLLIDPDYQSDIAYAIFKGAVMYFS